MPSKSASANVTASTEKVNDAAVALHFQGFSVLPHLRRVEVDGKPAKLGARAFEVLMVLLSCRDRVVSKQELMERVWPRLVVEENNLQVQMSTLRKICGPDAFSTVPGRGYQFTAASLEGTPAASTKGPSVANAHPVLSFAKPVSSGELFGRDVELVELQQMLSEFRWVTVSGAGGMGKTRLVQALIAPLRQQWHTVMVELAAVSDERLVPSAVAQVVGATVVDPENPLSAVVSALDGLDAVLILDNCEHLLQGVSDLVEALLEALPRLRVMVTSQEVLRRGDEHVYRLNPLPLPEVPGLEAARAAGAVQLLEARVQALQRSFKLTEENVDDAVTICAQLDGLPLAIELAAARVPHLGIAGVRQRLGELFRLLTGNARVKLRRHQTLRAALDWSYQLLQPVEQRLLQLLGTYAGSFSAEGVRHIAKDLAEDDWVVLDSLGLLIDKSLVQLRGDDSPRYALLETTRAYALEQLARGGDIQTALRRHAEATCHVCRSAIARRDTEAVWNEVANVRAAFQWALDNDENETAVTLAVLPSAVLVVGGLVGEVLERLVAVETRVRDDMPAALVAQYWQWLGRFGCDGRLPARRCLDALQKAEGLYQAMGKSRHVHGCLRMQAQALLELGDLDTAGEVLARARAMEEGHHTPLADRMRRLRVEGLVLEGQGRFEDALSRLADSRSLAVAADVPRYMANLAQDMGRCHLNAGSGKLAERHFLQVLSEQRPGDVTVALPQVYARIGLVHALLLQGKVGEARLRALEAITPLRASGIFLAQSEVFAWLLAALKQWEPAVVFVQSAEGFRAFSQTVRTPACEHALAQAKTLLGSRLTASVQLPPLKELEGSLASTLIEALNRSDT